MIAKVKRGRVKRPVSSDELIEFVRLLQEDRRVKVDRLKMTLERLNRARAQIRNQKEILRRLRARIVELTPPGSN